MAVAFPSIWVRLLLESPARMDEIVAAYPDLAEVWTKPGLFSIEPGVLARFTVGPLDPGTARACYPDGAPRVGAILDLSGGDPSFELEIGPRSPDPAVNRAARDLAGEFQVLVVRPDGVEDEQPALARVRKLLRVALRIAGYATGVVVPQAGVGYAAEEFVDLVGDNAAPQLIAGRVAMAVHEVHPRMGWLQSLGNLVYGIPDVGIYPRAFEARPVSRVVDELARDMQTWQSAPPEGAELDLMGERWWVSREGTGVWLAPAADRHYPDARAASRHANYQASFGTLARRQLNTMRIAEANTWKADEPTPRHYVDVSIQSDGTRLMTTNGVGFRPRRGVSAKKQGCIEVYALVPRDGMRIAMVLSALAACAHAASWWKPFRLFDRMPFPEPIAGIAGLLLAPRLTLQPLREAPPVTWCMAVPLTEEEIHRLRRKTLSGSDLVEDIDRRNAWPAIAERWRDFQPAD